MRVLDEETMLRLKNRQRWSKIVMEAVLIVVLLFIGYWIYGMVQGFQTPEVAPSIETHETSTTRGEPMVNSVVPEESIAEQRPESAPLSNRHREFERPQVVDTTEDFGLPESIVDNNKFWVCSGTVYNLTVGQCDGDPSTPACPGYYLTEKDAESLEYIAISRNLLSRNTKGAPFDCGETVYVTGMMPEYLNGYKVIVDVSGSHRNHVDFLTPLGISTGRSSNVRIYKLD